MWLEDFSEATNHSDAILMPFVIYMSEHQINDRGLEKAQSEAAVSMLLLIENGSGMMV